MKKDNGAKMIASFIESMYPSRGWWHMKPIPRKEDEHKGAESFLPLISVMLGLYVSAMATYLIDIGCLRRCRD